MSWFGVPPDPINLNLFAGGGGLAIGLHQAGLQPLHLYEFDSHACATLKHNTASEHSTILGEVYQKDLIDYDWKAVTCPVRIIAAGVPCQPFSLAGKHYADRDERNLFPVVLHGIRQLLPEAFLLENVRGLLRESCRAYFEYLIRALESPSLKPRQNESWPDHDKRIRSHRRSSSYEPEYNVAWRLLEAADYGVPQRRQRVFVVGVRESLGSYAFPKRTHSKGALIATQLNGTYWERRDLPRPDSLSFNRVPKQDSDLSPWVTVRDSIGDLPKPYSQTESSWTNHWHIHGARSYKGHTGSIYDWPSKTIKAGVHGVPGGENTIIGKDGCIRYYTLREAARLQSFPDSHFFQGARLHVTRQIGNAVPSLLAKVVAEPLAHILKAHSS